MRHKRIRFHNTTFSDPGIEWMEFRRKNQNKIEVLKCLAQTTSGWFFFFFSLHHIKGKKKGPVSNKKMQHEPHGRQQQQCPAGRLQRSWRSACSSAVRLGTDEQNEWRERRGEVAAVIPSKSLSKQTNITQRQKWAMKAREQRKEKIRDERGDSDAQRQSKTPKALVFSDGRQLWVWRLLLKRTYYWLTGVFLKFTTVQKVQKKKKSNPKTSNFRLQKNANDFSNEMF